MDNKIRKKAEKILIEFPNISSHELANILDIDERQARKLIKNLPYDMIVENIKNKKIASSKSGKTKSETNGVGQVLRGTISTHKDGYGFFIPDDKSVDDAFIHPKKLKNAAHGDVCTARISIYKGKREAEVVNIIQRGIEEVVGVVDKYRNSVRVIPFSRNFQGYIIIKDNKNIEDEDVVLCKIERYPTSSSHATGKIIEKIGTLSDKDIDNKIVMYKYGLTFEYSEKVIFECDEIENGRFKIDKKNLTDFRQLFTVTIDGERARDFDDAISVIKTDENYELFVHIADVSRYVTRGSAINEEAKRRGTSVYFPEFAIAMLPEVLSNGVCSLVPNEERYTVTCKIVYNRQGKRKDVSFYRSVIKSNHRLTYNFVNDVFNKSKECESHELFNLLSNAKELSELLISRGDIIDIKPQERGAAERLIECFMIAAKEAVAEYLENNGLKGIYRVHGEPDVKKIDDWVEMARNFGLKIPPRKYPVTPETVAELSKIAANSKQADLLSSLLIRSMMRAEYTVENQGHFGLALKAYTHFTSPIRRYPDLLVHRALLAGLKLGSINEPEEELKELARQCSKLERLAQDAEHDIGAFKKLEYISDHYEDVFEGYINRITNTGMFVYIEKLMMTGYVDYGYIDFDIFYKMGESAIGDKSGERYRVGDKLRLLPYKINIASLQADFTIYKKSKKNSKK